MKVIDERSEYGSFLKMIDEANTASPLTVAFIGGSLTECEIDYEGTSLDKKYRRWTETVCDFFGTLFPLREVRCVNVGLGGTVSHYGDVRFDKDVLSSAPDIVFIEFSCNDCPESPEDCDGEGRVERQVYLESMIRRCMCAEKVPAVIYMHVPLPYDGKRRELYRKGCEIKQEVLDYYGIGTVDVMTYMLQKFEAQRAKNEHLTLGEFYERYFPRYENGKFNVHPFSEGYELFAEAIIDAISNSPERYLHPPARKEELYCKAYADRISFTYRYTPSSDSSISYVGDWKLYTADSDFEREELFVKRSRLTDAQQFTDGIMQIYMPRDASFTFATEADMICMPYVSSGCGLGAEVFVNGELVGHISCHSIWQGMNYMGEWIPLGEGKKQVRVKIDEPYGEGCIYRFGYVVEAFRKRRQP